MMGQDKERMYVHKEGEEDTEREMNKAMMQMVGVNEWMQRSVYKVHQGC
jgi:hypothetical protein